MITDAKNLADRDLKRLYLLIVQKGVNAALAYHYADEIEGYSARAIILECADRFARRE